MRKQPNGTPGKKPPAPSVKPDAFRTLVEILKRRKPRRTRDRDDPGAALLCKRHGTV